MTELKYIADVRVSNVDKKTHEGEQAVRLCNYTDVYYGDAIDASHGEFMAASASAQQIAAFRLEVGDTVLTKDSETADDIGVSGYIARTADDFVCGYHLAIVRPRPGVHPRFLCWALRGASAREQMAVAATGVTRYGLRSDELANLDVNLPPLDEQRRIADFLDTQVGLLDRALGLRLQQKALLSERYEAEVERRIRPEGTATPEIPARFLVERVGVGIVIQPAALYTEDQEGVPAVRGKDISPGLIAPTDRLVKITREGHALNRRSELQRGDILVVRSGKAGAAAQVPDDLIGANCVDVVIVRPGSMLNPRYLEYGINCRRAQESISEHSVGAIQRHFGVEDMKALPLVPRSLSEQEQIGRSLDALVDQRRRTEDLLDRSLDLLKERKGALVTAAVTGAFDVTTARSAA
ncbi:restriction endonuclease subunit S [Geodermatophilus sp. SYSU D01106]